MAAQDLTSTEITAMTAFADIAAPPPDGTLAAVHAVDGAWRA